MKEAAREISGVVREKILAIRGLIFDVDGVLTDGRIVLWGTNGEAKGFDVQDGHGIRMAGREGALVMAMITARRSVVVERQARELRISHVYQGARDKETAYERFKAKTGLKDGAIAYMGDDVVDLPLLRRVGLALAPANAVSEVKSTVDYVTAASGGRGAAREAIELILKLQGRWEPLLEPCVGEVG